MVSQDACGSGDSIASSPLSGVLSGGGESVVDDILVSALLCREDHIYLAITCTTSNSHKRLSFPGPEN